MISQEKLADFMEMMGAVLEACDNMERWAWYGLDSRWRGETDMEHALEYLSPIRDATRALRTRHYDDL